MDHQICAEAPTVAAYTDKAKVELRGESYEKVTRQKHYCCCAPIQSCTDDDTKTTRRKTRENKDEAEEKRKREDHLEKVKVRRTKD